MPDSKQSCPSISRVTGDSLAVTLTCTLAVFLTAGPLRVAAQQASSTGSFIAVTVADRYHRVVTGLDKESFVVLENGFPRSVTYFSNVDSPLTVAILSDLPFPSDDILKPEDELIQTSSLSDAVRQVMASKNQRKAIIVTGALDLHGIPAGIEVVQTNLADVLKVVTELHNQYVLGFRRSDPAGLVEVKLNQPRNLAYPESRLGSTFLV